MIGQTLGHYRVLEKVGAGGMGVVYRARDEHLERDVALKVLPSGTLGDDSARRSFRREALALAKLNHPNIETVYEFGSQEGTDFLVMEYVPGNTLAQKLARGPMAEKEIVALGMQIAAALEEAHDRGIVHRDLKPANIAITARGQAKVLDFGLAKLLHPDQELTTDYLTDSRAVPGTLPYMAPEQLRADRIDARADIYTAGVVLYEMATNRKPFAGDLPSQVIDAILHEPPLAPRALNARISAELERIILKCMDKEPEQRYQSAKELSVDLRRLAAPSAGVFARPASRSFWRRATTPVFVGLAALLAFGLTLTAFNVSGLRDRLVGRTRPPQIRSLAVLPLENRSGDPDQEYFADGMTDELITELAEISALKVISQTSVMRYKSAKRSVPEIARSLHVDAIVEGSVQRIGQHVRISARLIQARNGQEQPVWAHSYERGFDDVLVLQRDVAQAIVTSIEGAIKPNGGLQKRAVDPLAHEAYLKGLYYWNKRTPDGLKKALQYFQQAVEKDPNYALAYSGLSDTFAFAPELGMPEEQARAKQKAAALRAVELNDTLSEAHTSLGNALTKYWQWDGAEREYKRAIELNPNYATAHHWHSTYLSLVGRHDDAIAEAKRALELDPLSLIIQANLGGRYLYARRYDNANEECQKAVDMDSTFAVGHTCLGFVRLQQRRIAEAITELEQAAHLSDDPESLAALAYAYSLSGKTSRAESIERKLKNFASDKYLPDYYIAIVETGLGHQDQALRWLERAYQHRSAELADANIEPMLDPLRHGPRFNDLLRKVRLPSP